MTATRIGYVRCSTDQQELTDVRTELGRTRTELRAAVNDREALRTRAEVLAGGVEDGRRRLEALRAELADAERQQEQLTGRAELAAVQQRHQELRAALTGSAVAPTEPDRRSLTGPGGAIAATSEQVTTGGPA